MPDAGAGDVHVCYLLSDTDAGRCRISLREKSAVSLITLDIDGRVASLTGVVRSIQFDLNRATGMRWRVEMDLSTVASTPQTPKGNNSAAGRLRRALAVCTASPDLHALAVVLDLADPVRAGRPRPLCQPGPGECLRRTGLEPPPAPASSLRPSIALWTSHRCRDLRKLPPCFPSRCLGKQRPPVDTSTS
jgi:hypothetical protein